MKPSAAAANPPEYDAPAPRQVCASDRSGPRRRGVIHPWGTLGKPSAEFCAFLPVPGPLATDFPPDFTPKTASQDHFRPENTPSLATHPFPAAPNRKHRQQTPSHGMCSRPGAPATPLALRSGALATTPARGLPPALHHGGTPVLAPNINPSGAHLASPLHGTLRHLPASWGAFWEACVDLACDFPPIFDVNIDFLGAKFEGFRVHTTRKVFPTHTKLAGSRANILRRGNHPDQHPHHPVAAHRAPPSNATQETTSPGLRPAVWQKQGRTPARHRQPPW